MKRSLKKLKDLSYFNIAIGAVLLALFLSVSALLFIRLIERKTDEATYLYLSELASVSAREIRAKIDGDMETLAALSTLFGFREELQTPQFIDILKEENENNGFDSMAYVTPDGILYGVVTNSGIDVSQVAYFQNAKRGERSLTFLSEGRFGSGRVGVYSVPIYRDGVFAGALAGVREQTAYQQLVEGSIFSGNGFSNIIDSEGTILIRSQNEHSSQHINNLLRDVAFHDDVTEQKMAADLQAGRSGVAEYSINGTPRMAAYTPLGINNWYIVTLVPTDIAKASGNFIIACTLTLGMLIVIGMVLLFILITLKQVKHRKAIERMAFTDELTGGCNLCQFKRLAAELLPAGESSRLMLVYLDLDNFKIINDMYGFDEGDRVLRDMHAAIGSVVQAGELYARTVNDHFVALTAYESEEDIQTRGEQFRESFIKLHLSENRSYKISFTTGLYKLSAQETDIATIIERAAMAHKIAKGMNTPIRFCVYDEKIRDTAIREKTIENIMQDALAREEFLVYLQPKFSLQTGEMTGAEALVRWLTAQDTILPPGEFIPLFERNGFIVSLDLYVFEQVCKMQRKWLDAGITPVPISINQSELLISSPDYVEKVYGLVQKHRIPPQLIEIELLESLVHDNLTLLNGIIERLKALGFIISIDDFGSGYSSLNMLKDIKADVLKIDRGFLNEAENSNRGEIVLSNVIQLAKNLKMSVVVEGVETEKQAVLLRSLGSDSVQGFLFARPMPVSAFEQRRAENEI